METDFKKVLVEKLKAQGLNAAEDAAKIIVEAVFETAEEIVKATPNMYDNLLLPVIGLAKPEVLKLVDKIDGQEG